jgi:hypothetical protein
VIILVVLLLMGHLNNTAKTASAWTCSARRR